MWKNLDKASVTKYEKAYEENKKKVAEEVKKYEAKYGPVSKRKGKGSRSASNSSKGSSVDKNQKKTKR